MIGRSDAAGFRCVELHERLVRRDLGLAFKISGDGFLPNVRLLSLHLLRHDVFPRENFVRPPRHTTPIAMDGFGEKLVAVVR